MGCAAVNSHVSWTGYEKTRPAQELSVKPARYARGRVRTSNDFGALEVLVRVQIAR